MDTSITFSGTDDGYSGISLVNGTYTLTVASGLELGGTPLATAQTFTFARLYGDFGAGVVNSADFVIVVDDLGVTLPANMWYVSETDGVVNSEDFTAVVADEGVTEASDSGNIVSGSFTDVIGDNNVVLGVVSVSSQEDFFYSSQWQVIQEDSLAGTGSPVLVAQNVWGQAYVNELVLRDSNDDGSSSTGNLGIAGSGLDERIYALQNTNWSVTTLIEVGSGVVERFTYDPAGVVTVLGGTSWSTTVDMYDWVYMYQGGRFDSMTGLYVFEHRDYDPALERWVEQDPDGYVDGENTYQALGDNSLRWLDPGGTDFIALCDRSVRGKLGLGYLTPYYHYSLEHWSANCGDGPTQPVDISDFKEDNRPDTATDGVELWNETWYTAAAGGLVPANSKIILNWVDTSVSVIHYNTVDSVRMISLLDGPPSVIDAAWKKIILAAQSYPYAEQDSNQGVALHWPNSEYQSTAANAAQGIFGNNSNTFIRWLILSVGLPFKQLPGDHPGNFLPDPINNPDPPPTRWEGPVSHIQGGVF